MANKKLTPEIESVLRAAKIEGNTLTLVGQLDKSLYKKVADFIEICGGKWNRGKKCHLFTSDPSKLLFALEKAEKGEPVEVLDEKKERQAFYTPQSLVEEVTELADIENKIVLEPSFGDGRFIKECLKRGAAWVDGIELNYEEFEKTLSNFQDSGMKNFHLEHCDFLEWIPPVGEAAPMLYDVLLMNPPFSKNQWRKHIEHAYKFLKMEGKIVAITPNSLSDKRFQEFVSDKRWEFKKVEAGSFKESGTNIATNIVTIWKN